MRRAVGRCGWRRAVGMDGDAMVALGGAARWVGAVTLRWVMLASAALRLALVVFGEWQDAHLDVRYTDVDYLVFSDAAASVAAGGSPFARDTSPSSSSPTRSSTPLGASSSSQPQVEYCKAAFWYGLIAHFRIYPIIYAIPFVIVLGKSYAGPAGSSILTQWSSKQHLQNEKASVMTAQYFVWFFCLLPLILPWTSMKLKWKGLACILVWMGSQLHWLMWVFVQLWVAGLMFLAADTFVMLMLIRHHKYTPLFSSSVKSGSKVAIKNKKE